jgi:hypothetical protein
MMRPLAGFAVVGSMPTFLPAPITGIRLAASNTATTLFPLDGPNQLKTHMFLNCLKADGHCDFTAGANMRTPDGVTGFPPGLWARQTTEIRSSNRMGYLDAHAWSTGQPKADVNVITCTHIQVVYTAVNITSPSTCAQATFS